MSNHVQRIDASTLVDIRDVHIDSELPKEQRIRSFIQQIRNPYCFKVGDVVVNVSYTGGDTTLTDRFTGMLAMLG